MMRRLATTCGVLVLLLAAGCSRDPAVRWAQGREALTALQTTGADLWEQGLLEPEAVLVADPAIQAARAALDAAGRRLDSGDDVGTFLDAAEAAVLAATQAQLVRRTRP